MTALLQVDSVHKYYGEAHVVQGVSFDLAQGDIGCLLGPSGCGKTTLLRIIAGFEDIASGSVTIDGQVVSGARYVPPEKRRIGMVFQDYALFPHLTVVENVAFGIADKPAAQRKGAVDRLLQTVGLSGEAGRYPHELSGGQQQRVALARALAPEPRLLLMDEPFSNLDVTLREALSGEIREILKAQNTTALMVTHNQHEAFAMADKVGMVSCGVMQQWDIPYAVYHRPANPTVAGFVGEGVLLRGAVGDDGAVRCALGDLGRSTAADPGAEVGVLVRPEDIQHDDESPFHARIESKTFRGPSILYVLRLETGEQVLALAPSHHDHALGQTLGVRVAMDEVVLFHRGATLEDGQLCPSE